MPKDYLIRTLAFLGFLLVVAYGDGFSFAAAKEFDIDVQEFPLIRFLFVLISMNLFFKK